VLLEFGKKLLVANHVLAAAIGFSLQALELERRDGRVTSGMGERPRHFASSSADDALCVVSL
jgi:hypothetical protein